MRGYAEQNCHLNRLVLDTMHFYAQSIFVVVRALWRRQAWRLYSALKYLGSYSRNRRNRPSMPLDQVTRWTPSSESATRSSYLTGIATGEKQVAFSDILSFTLYCLNCPSQQPSTDFAVVNIILRHCTLGSL